MPVLESRKDTDALTLTFVTEHAASPEQVWQLWEDPRKLEQWWGPPTWPATFDRHELTPGGESRYYMTGPDGTKAAGWFETVETEAPHRLVVKDGFSGADGEPTDPDDYTTATVTLEAVDGGTRMTIVAQFLNAEQLSSMVEMGMQEGMGLALGQIDDVLAG